MTNSWMKTWEFTIIFEKDKGEMWRKMGPLGDLTSDLGWGRELGRMLHLAETNLAHLHPQP